MNQTNLVQQLRNTEHWQTLQTQAFINGIVGIIFILILTACVVTYYYISENVARNSDRGMYSQEVKEFYKMISFSVGLLLFIIILVTLAQLGDTFNALFHPDYWVLNKVLNIR